MRLKLIVASLLAAAAWADVVTDVRAALAKNNLPLAESLVQNYRAQKGVTPEMLEALSWLGRGSLAAKQLGPAETYYKQTQRQGRAEHKNRPLEGEPHLPLALGAAIEVQAQIMNERG